MIAGYEARFTPEVVGLKLAAFAFVGAEERTSTGRTGQALAAIPNVQELHNLASEDCSLVKHRVRDTDDPTRAIVTGCRLASSRAGVASAAREWGRKASRKLQVRAMARA